MSASALKRLSWDEYIAHERQATEKSQYFDGELFAMAGGHTTVASSDRILLGNRGMLSNLATVRFMAATCGFFARVVWERIPTA